MTIGIYAAGPDDAAEMVSVGMRAFADDKLSEAQFGIKNATPEQLREFHEHRTANSKLRMQGKGRHWFKAVDESKGKIVGFCGLCSPEAEPVPTWSISRPALGSLEVDKEVESKLDEFKKRWVGGRDDVWCK